MIRDPFLVFFVIALVVAISIWLARWWVIARRLGSVLFSILLALVLSNVGVLPATSPAYDAVNGVGVSIAVAFILLGVDLRAVKAAGPRMLVAFGLGALGTIV
ncbi:MAG: DUF819 family protein, partial [Vicinamibacterales bacterium]